MSKKATHSLLIQAYRNSLKQLNKLGKVEPVLSNHFSTVITNIRSNREGSLKFKNLQQAKLFTQGLSHLLTNANLSHKKSMIKLMRIFLNQSKFVTDTLVFKDTYLPRSIERLHQDIEYQELSIKDQAKVKNIINRICNSKIRTLQFKFTSVGQYLISNTSQSAQDEIVGDSKTQLEAYFKDRQNIYGQLFRQINIKSEKKMENAIEQLYQFNLILI